MSVLYGYLVHISLKTHTYTIIFIPGLYHTLRRLTFSMHSILKQKKNSPATGISKYFQLTITRHFGDAKESKCHLSLWPEHLLFWLYQMTTCHLLVWLNAPFTCYLHLTNKQMYPAHSQLECICVSVYIVKGSHFSLRKAAQ